MTEKFGNSVLFVRIDLPSTVIRHENGALRKRSSNQRNLKTAAFCFGVNRKTFENGALRKRCSHFNHVISLSEFSSNTNPKQAMIVAFSKLLRSIVNGKHLMHFQREISVFKFLSRQQQKTLLPK